MTDNNLDLVWLDNFLKHFPKKEKSPKSFYDIARFPRRENVISNVMQFYFSEEEHGLKRLFFDALLEGLIKKASIQRSDLTTYSTPYTVEREVNNIDILIKDIKQNWAIVIEHKVDHWLHNPLDRYLESVSIEDKKLVVLSLHEIPIPEQFKSLPCVNITYLELIYEIENQLKEYDNSNTNKHFYFMDDFLQHLKKLTNMSNYNEENEKSLKIFQGSISQVNKILAMRNQLREYTFNQLVNAFRTIGYFPYYSSKDRQWNHFFCNDKFFIEKGLVVPKTFRFYVDIDELFESRKLILYFELFNEDSIHGANLREYLVDNKLIKLPLLVSDGEQKESYCHLTGYLELPINATNSLANEFHKLIYDTFLADERKGLINICTEQLAKLKK